MWLIFMVDRPPTSLTACFVSSLSAVEDADHLSTLTFARCSIIATHSMQQMWLLSKVRAQAVHMLWRATMLETCACDSECLASSGHEPAHAHLCVVAPVLADFRAEVIWSADASLSQLHGATQHLGHSKITKFEQTTSRHEYILRLDVSAYSRVACV